MRALTHIFCFVLDTPPFISLAGEQLTSEARLGKTMETSRAKQSQLRLSDTNNRMVNGSSQ